MIDEFDRDQDGEINAEEFVVRSFVRIAPASALELTPSEHPLACLREPSSTS